MNRDQLRAERDLLLWLHAEAVWQLGRVRSSREDWAVEALRLEMAVDVLYCTLAESCPADVHHEGCDYRKRDSAPAGGDLPSGHEWYPRECEFCTRDAALACTDPSCRERRLGEDHDTPVGGGSGV